MVKNLNLFLLISYLIVCFSMKYFGFLMPKIQDTNYNYCYKSYKKIAKKNKAGNIAGIIIKTKDKIEVIPVMKKIIGTNMINNEIYFIDSSGNLFQSADEDHEDYITVSGEYKYWAAYYEELEKYPNILEKIYHANIYHYRIDLYLAPGILIKLNRSIKDLDEFYKTFPKFFKKKNKYIDLRNTKKVGYADYELTNLENSKENIFTQTD